MPVDPADVDAITANVTAIYRDGEMELGRLIANHLRAGNATGPAWAVERMAATSALRRASELVANRLRNRGAQAARAAMAQAYRTGGQAALDELPRERRIEARAARAARDVVPGGEVVESLASALVRDIGDRSNNVLRDTMDAYRSVITGTVARMTTTGATRLEASQQAWQALVDRGVTGFTDRAGRRWELSTYVEMATRTVAQRAAVQGQTDRLGELGVDLVQVSNAPQECERCRPFEGKILARDGGGQVGKVKFDHATEDGKQVTVNVMTTLPEARSRGLFHPQCRHSIKAHLPGVTKPEPGPTADPDGDKARQKQRKIERDIRKAKQQAELAIDPAAKKAFNAKVKAKQGEMRDHLAANPQLLRQSHREQAGASNLGRGVSATPLEAPQTAAKKAATKQAAPPAKKAAPSAKATAPAAPAKATPPAAPQTATPPSPNPPVITGSPRRWQDALPANTGDTPVPVRDLVIDGYTVREGSAWRLDGILYLIEHGTPLDARLIRDQFRNFHRTLPPEADRYQTGYAWLAGRNPADAYWERRYNMPGFSSLATAGDGSVRMWNRAQAAFGPDGHTPSLRHEFGHNVSTAAQGRGLDHQSRAWSDSVARDRGAQRPADITFGPLWARNVRLRPDPSKNNPDGVTEYGQSSASEDYAESMAMYLGGVLGRARLTPGGKEVPIYFRDVWPGRAAVFDQVFPEIAKQQLAAIARR